VNLTLGDQATWMTARYLPGSRRRSAQSLFKYGMGQDETFRKADLNQSII
jgi:hypothetical protein